MTMSAKSTEQTQRRDYSCPKWRPLLNLGTYEQNIYIYICVCVCVYKTESCYSLKKNPNAM